MDKHDKYLEYITTAHNLLVEAARQFPSIVKLLPTGPRCQVVEFTCNDNLDEAYNHIMDAISLLDIELRKMNSVE